MVLKTVENHYKVLITVITFRKIILPMMWRKVLKGGQD